jgi:SAM-dependent methyltransferase
MATPVRCPACGGAGSSPWWSDGRFAYVACADCGLPRLAPLPDPAAAASLYGEGYFSGAEHGGYANYLADARLHRSNARRHLRRLARLGAAPPGRLVELGAAAGFLLDEARAAGWEVSGAEISAPMRARCRELHGIELAPLRPLAGTARAAVANQVLEHLVDPLAALGEIGDLLAPGGLLSLETWDRGALVARASGRRWQQITPPSVLWLWDRAELARLLRRAGFEPLQVRASMKLVSLGTVLGQLRPAGPTARAATGSTRRGAGRLARLPLPYALGDLVVAVARRR